MINWWEVLRESKRAPLGKHTIQLDNPSGARIHVSPRSDRKLIRLQLGTIKVLADLRTHYIEDLKTFYGNDVVEEAIKCCDVCDIEKLTKLADRIAQDEFEKELSCDKFRIEEEIGEL